MVTKEVSEYFSAQQSATDSAGFRSPLGAESEYHSDDSANESYENIPTGEHQNSPKQPIECAQECSFAHFQKPIDACSFLEQYENCISLEATSPEACDQSSHFVHQDIGALCIPTYQEFTLSHQVEETPIKTLQALEDLSSTSLQHEARCSSVLSLAQENFANSDYEEFELLNLHPKTEELQHLSTEQEISFVSHCSSLLSIANESPIEAELISDGIYQAESEDESIGSRCSTALSLAEETLLDEEFDHVEVTEVRTPQELLTVVNLDAKPISQRCSSALNITGEESLKEEFEHIEFFSEDKPCESRVDSIQDLRKLGSRCQSILSLVNECLADGSEELVQLFQDQETDDLQFTENPGLEIRASRCSSVVSIVQEIQQEGLLEQINRLDQSLEDLRLEAVEETTNLLSSQQRVSRCSSLANEDLYLQEDEQVEFHENTQIDASIRENIHKTNTAFQESKKSKPDLTFVQPQTSDLEESLEEEEIPSFDICSIASTPEDFGKEEKDYSTPLLLASREDSLEFAKEDLELYESPTGTFELDMTERVEKPEQSENGDIHDQDSSAVKKRKASLWASVQQRSGEVETDFAGFYAIDRTLPELSSDRYLNFAVQATGIKVGGVEGQALHLLDVDNPDLWLVKTRPGTGISSIDEEGVETRDTSESESPQIGRLDAVCTSRTRPTENKKKRDTREQFREEVLTFSNKQQEASLKKRYVVTELSETEKEYQSTLSHLETLLNSYTGKYSMTNDATEKLFPPECLHHIEGMKRYLPSIIALSEWLVDYLNFTAFLFHRMHLENILSNLPVLDISMHLEDEVDPIISMRHFLQLTNAPKERLNAYKMTLQDLARYTARGGLAKEGVERLQEAMTGIQRTERQATEMIELWPSVEVQELQLNELLSLEDFKKAPKPITRLTDTEFSINDTPDPNAANTFKGRVILCADRLLLLQLAKTKWNCVHQIILGNMRIGETSKDNTVEVWDLGQDTNPIKKIALITLPNKNSHQAWIDDLKEAIQSVTECETVPKSVVDAHNEAALSRMPKFAEEQLLEVELGQDTQLMENGDHDTAEEKEESPRIDLQKANTEKVPTVLQAKRKAEEKEFKLCAETKSLEVKEGDSIQLEVAFSSSGSMATEFRWLFENEAMKPEMGASATLSASKTKLIICPANPKMHAGTYTCLGKTFDGREASVSLVVKVVSAEIFDRPDAESGAVTQEKPAPLKPIVNFIDIPLGKILELKVEINRVEAAKLSNIFVSDKYNPWQEAEIQWFQGDKELKAGKSCQIFEEDGCSVLRVLTSKEQEAQGVYTCIMQPPPGSASLSAHAVSIEVQTHKATKEEIGQGFKEEKELPFRPLEEKPIIKIERKFKTGDDLELVFENSYGEDIQGYEVKWLKDGKTIPKNFKNEGFKLHKTNLKENDSGQYTCILVPKEKDFPSLIVSQFSIQVEKKLPEFPSVKTEEINFKLGEDMILRSADCVTKEVLEEFTVCWLKDGKPLDEKAVEISNNVTQFAKANLQPQDSGLFECILKCKNGAKEKPVTLISAKVAIKVEPQNLKINYGEELELKAPAEGKVTWLKDGKKMEENTAILRKPSLRSCDAGLYECVQEKTAIAKFKVEVKKPNLNKLQEAKKVVPLNVAEGDPLSLKFVLPIVKEEMKFYKVQWTQNGKDIGAAEILNEETNSTANIDVTRNAKTDQSGLYECVAVPIDKELGKIVCLAKYDVIVKVNSPLIEKKIAETEDAKVSEEKGGEQSDTPKEAESEQQDLKSKNKSEEDSKKKGKADDAKDRASKDEGKADKSLDRIDDSEESVTTSKKPENKGKNDEDKAAAKDKQKEPAEKKSSKDSEAKKKETEEKASDKEKGKNKARDSESEEQIELEVKKDKVKDSKAEKKETEDKASDEDKGKKKAKDIESEKQKEPEEKKTSKDSEAKKKETEDKASDENKGKKKAKDSESEEQIKPNDKKTSKDKVKDSKAEKKETEDKASDEDKGKKKAKDIESEKQKEPEEKKPSKDEVKVDKKKKGPDETDDSEDKMKNSKADKNQQGKNKDDNKDTKDDGALKTIEEQAKEGKRGTKDKQEVGLDGTQPTHKEDKPVTEEKAKKGEDKTKDTADLKDSKDGADEET
ncbi:hypothetical protein Ciccas_005258, partial [Cichlidogyrus casuarinus]